MSNYYNQELEASRYEEGKAGLFVAIAWVVISTTTALIKTGVI